MEDVDAVLVRSATKITRDSLARAQRLKVIGRAGVGVDTIDVDAATENGVAVLTAPSGNTISACELTFALLLALVRRVPAADRSMHDGAWDRKSFNGAELYGKTWVSSVRAALAAKWRGVRAPSACACSSTIRISPRSARGPSRRSSRPSTTCSLART